MRAKIKAIVVNALKIPADPEAPAGSRESVRIFRAAPNFYKLCLAKWALTQVGAVLGLVALLVLFHFSDRIFGEGHFHFHLILLMIHLAGAAGLLLVIPFTYVMVRLDYELRWYIVTDRSLRIRSGLVRIREMTMNFANIQQITINQGPLQRWLGIADLEVSTAGGGGDSHAEPGKHGHHEPLHLGYFHGVDNAQEIRDLMLQRLRHFRDAGLGDPDDIHVPVPQPTAAAATVPDALAAARELLAESRALRQVLG